MINQDKFKIMFFVRCPSNSIFSSISLIILILTIHLKACLSVGDFKFQTPGSQDVSQAAQARIFQEDEHRQQNLAFQIGDKQDQQMLEDDLLTLFGLSRKPRLRRHKAHQEAGPQYLMDLYRTLLDDSNGLIRENLSSEDRNNLSAIIQGANGVLKNSLFQDFGHENNEITRQQNLLDIVDSDQIMTFTNEVRNRKSKFLTRKRDRKLWFNVAHIPIDSYRLVDAELRLYRDFSRSRLNDTIPLFIRLYAMQMGGPERELQFQLVDSVQISGYHSGWLRFNLTEPVLNWLHKQKSNLGLYLQVRSDLFNRDLHPRRVGIITHGRSNDQTSQQPFLTVYLKQTKPQKMRRPKHFYERASALFDDDYDSFSVSQQYVNNVNDSRSRRSATGNGDSRKRSPNGPGFEGDDFNTFYNDKQHACMKRRIFVSFRDLNWQDWIIAPDGYMAFFCDGQCSFPLNEFYPTNHAILQGLLHQWNKLNILKPCCTPRELSSIMVLYFDENSNAVLKKFKNMVVKKCGCS